MRAVRLWINKTLQQLVYGMVIVQRGKQSFANWNFFYPQFRWESMNHVELSHPSNHHLTNGTGLHYGGVGPLELPDRWRMRHLEVYKWIYQPEIHHMLVINTYNIYVMNIYDICIYVNIDVVDIGIYRYMIYDPS